MATTIPTVKEVQAALLANVEPAEWKGGKGPNAGGILSRVRSAMAEGRALDSALVAEVFAAFNKYQESRPKRLLEVYKDACEAIERHTTGLRRAQKAKAEAEAELQQLGIEY